MKSILFDCPNCNQTYESETHADGMDFTCPGCNFQFTVLTRKAEAGTPAIAAPPAPVRREFIATTTNEVAGCTITEYLGIATGIVVRTPKGMESIVGGFEKLFGGNNEAYSGICAAARQEAFARMVRDARQKNADAIIAFRYDATEFSPGITEVLAYGTAVKLTQTI